MSPVGLFALAVLAAMLVSMFLWSANFRAPRDERDVLPGADYFQFFVAGQLIRHGHQDRLYDFEFVKAFQHDPAVIPYRWNPDAFLVYIYPPFFAWFCLPAAYLPFHAGAIVWALVMTGFLLASLGLLVRRFPNAPGGFGWVLLACLAYRPVLMSIYTCQNATLSLFILTLAFVLLRGGRPAMAGLVFSALAFKPQLTLVIGLAMLCKRQWRFVAGAAAGGLLLLLASLAVSPSATLDYVRLAPGMSKWIEMPGMPLERMSCWYGYWRLAFAGRPLALAQAATLVTSLITLVPLVWTLRGPLSPGASCFPMQFAAMVLATVVLSPHLLAYDLTLLVLPLFLLVAHAFEAPAAEGRGLGLWAVILFVAAAISESLAAVTNVQMIVPAILVAMVVLAGQPIPVAGCGGAFPARPEGGPHPRSVPREGPA